MRNGILNLLEKGTPPVDPYSKKKSTLRAKYTKRLLTERSHKYCVQLPTNMSPETILAVAEENPTQHSEVQTADRRPPKTLPTRNSAC
jgi:hypothetical protein